MGDFKSPVSTSFTIRAARRDFSTRVVEMTNPGYRPQAEPARAALGLAGAGYCLAERTIRQVRSITILLDAQDSLGSEIHGGGDRRFIGVWLWRVLRRHLAVDGHRLRRAAAGAGDGVGTLRIAPVGDRKS